MKMISRATLNVAQCGLGLCFVLFSLFANSAIETTALADMHKHDDSISAMAGYYSQTIINAGYIISNLLAPPFVSILGCRWSLVAGSLGFTLLMSQFLYLSNFTLYAFSAFQGLTAGLMWSAVGFYMSLNSTSSSIGKMSSLLWLVCCTSNIFGGIFLLTIFSIINVEEIDQGLRTILFSTFCGVALMGNIIYALLRNVPKEAEIRAAKRGRFVAELMETFRMIPTKKMLLLMFPYALTGLQTSFYSAVYPTSLSFTKTFPFSSKIVLGMNNLAVGVGQISGCLLCLSLDRFTARFGRASILIIATVCNLIAFIVIALDIPGNASFEETSDVSVFPASPILAVIGGFLLGIVDSAFNCQCYAITSSLYKDNCPQAMALFKFYHAILSTVSMFYGSVFRLEVQMGILFVLTAVSTVTYALAERRCLRSENEETETKLESSVEKMREFE